MTDITMTRVLVTPEVAAELLKGNYNNRGISSSKMREYMRDMLRGGWKGDVLDPIQISPEGRLVNGQHRLTAIVKTKVSLELWVARNVPDEHFSYIDQGKPRSVSDTMKSLHVLNNTSAAAMFRILHGMMNERYDSRDFNNRDAEQFTQDYRDHLIWAASLGVKARSWPTAGMVGAVCFLGGMSHKEKVEDFVQRLASGEMLKKGDPILTLRQRIERDTHFKGRGKVLLSPGEYMPVVVKAWNAHARGKELHQITIKPEQGFLGVVGAKSPWKGA